MKKYYYDPRISQEAFEAFLPFQAFDSLMFRIKSACHFRRDNDGLHKPWPVDYQGKR